MSSYIKLSKVKRKKNLINFFLFYRSMNKFYFRHPPDKRPNYSRLGSATPFECPWSVLVKDWTKEFVPNKKEEPGKYKKSLQ